MMTNYLLRLQMSKGLTEKSFYINLIAISDWKCALQKIPYGSPKHRWLYYSEHDVRQSQNTSKTSLRHMSCKERQLVPFWNYFAKKVRDL